MKGLSAPVLLSRDPIGRRLVAVQNDVGPFHESLEVADRPPARPDESGDNSNPVAPQHETFLVDAVIPFLQASTAQGSEGQVSRMRGGNGVFPVVALLPGPANRPGGYHQMHRHEERAYGRRTDSPAHP